MILNEKNNKKSPTIIDHQTSWFPLVSPRVPLGFPWAPSWPPLVHPQGRSQRDAPEKKGDEDADAPLTASAFATAKSWETDSVSGTLKGLGLITRIYSTHTHMENDHISQNITNFTWTNSKGGYDHQVINRILVAQDTVWEQMFVAGPNCWRSSPQFSGDPGMQSCPTCLHMLGVIPGLHCIHNIYIYICECVCVWWYGDVYIYI